jgi:hypothetical protein
MVALQLLNQPSRNKPPAINGNYGAIVGRGSVGAVVGPVVAVGGGTGVSVGGGRGVFVGPDGVSVGGVATVGMPKVGVADGTTEVGGTEVGGTAVGGIAVGGTRVCVGTEVFVRTGVLIGPIPPDGNSAVGVLVIVGVLVEVKVTVGVRVEVAVRRWEVDLADVETSPGKRSEN